jgi:hypothetical protein
VTISRWVLAPRSEGSDSTERAANRIVSRSAGSSPSIEDVAEPASGALHTQELDNLQPHGNSFVTQAVGVMEVRGREPLRPPVGISVLAILEVSFHDSAEGRIEEKLPAQAVDQGGETGDRSHEDEPSRPHDTLGLLERAESIVALGEVAEAPGEAPHRRYRLGPQCASVSDLRRDASRTGQPLHLPHVAVHRVNNVNLVAVVRQPDGVHTRRTADVQDLQWSGR